MVQILRILGFKLNPNDKVVNGIFRRVEANDGNCPCLNDSQDTHCPCSNYREKQYCCCGLYVRE